MKNAAKFWRNVCWFSSFNFQGNWPQYISHKFLHTSGPQIPHGWTKILSQRYSGSWWAQETAPKCLKLFSCRLNWGVANEGLRDGDLRIVNFSFACFDVDNVKMRELGCSGRGPGEAGRGPGEAGRGPGEERARDRWGRGCERAREETLVFAWYESVSRAKWNLLFKDMWGTRAFFLHLLDFPAAFRNLWKRAKKAEKGRLPERAARNPLNLHLLRPHLRQPN